MDTPTAEVRRTNRWILVLVLAVIVVPLLLCVAFVLMAFGAGLVSGIWQGLTGH